MTIAKMIEKYERMLNQCGPGDAERGFLIEQVLDDLAGVVKQDCIKDIDTIKGMAYKTGYNECDSKWLQAVRQLVDQRLGNGG